jgi:flavin-dependent dehydrogenase
MDDVLIVGAGPAGAVAATVLARAGARVRILDRASFPRDKLCGDTVNPGALAELRRLGLAGPVEAVGLRIDGMRVSGPGVTIDGRYPDGLCGRSLLRRDLDWALLRQAVEAGAQFDEGVAVRRAIVEQSSAAKTVAGVTVAANGHEQRLRAGVTIAADGRRSTLAFSLGLAHHPAAPRRWAVGAYYEGALGLSSLGEMHINRAGGYLGVAPVPGGLANVCLVRPSQPGDRPLRAPATLLATEIERDPRLRDRFARARLVQPPVVLGPLAIDANDQGVAGLLLAGDAAGFIDPMTGDGLRFAIRGGVLAGQAALEALSGGWHDVHARLTSARHREFGAKWRFNRALRATVASPAAVRVGALTAGFWPGLFHRIISVAGDCGVASTETLDSRLP